MLKIIGVPSEILRKKALPVEKIEDWVKELIREMTETLEKSHRPGIGLAAPQVGKNLRIILVKNDRTGGSPSQALINPEIVSVSKQKEIAYEGCLSIPDTFCPVERYKKIVVKALNQNGAKITIKAADLFARVLQHEIDHLDGVLITDKAAGKILTESEYNNLIGAETVVLAIHGQ